MNDKTIDQVRRYNIFKLDLLNLKFTMSWGVGVVVNIAVFGTVVRGSIPLRPESKLA